MLLQSRRGFRDPPVGARHGGFLRSAAHQQLRVITAGRRSKGEGGREWRSLDGEGRVICVRLGRLSKQDWGQEDPRSFPCSLCAGVIVLPLPVSMGRTWHPPSR